ncbi:MAG: signal recognition particle subunit [Candidatus Sumerlaeota bacterium]|nr:signal recognition particle subunit [Candidatus Sumerlaeota bacterium]
MFETLGDKFEGIFRKLRGQKSLSEDNIKEAMREVRMALLEADVNYLIVKEFVSRVRETAVGQEIVKGVDPAQQLFYIVHKELVRMMEGEAETDKPFAVQPAKENNIMLLGLQGAGKTTFCGKLARWIEKEGCKPLLVACDVYRPAAIEQLKQVGGGLGIPVFEMGTETPPLKIVQEARKWARENHRDTLLIDTAGRLHIDEVKMEELQGIRDTIKPDYVFLVADAMTGQDAVNSAKSFNDEIGIDGVCLTKLDGDARGGAALSIKAVTGKPVVFVGVGEKPDDLERFHPDRVAQRILGMGDVSSLVEKAQEAIDETEAESLREKLGEGKFTYDDFIKQMKMINRMGSLKGLLGMLPGVGNMLRDVDNDALKKEFGRVEAIILSMTKQERDNPDLIRTDGRRRDRIAKGSGHTLKQVNDLVRQFEQMRAMMQQMAGGGGMLGGLKGMMGKGAKGGETPSPDAFGPGAMPQEMPQPGSREYKEYRRQLKQMKQLERQSRPTTAPLPRNQRKRQRKKNR